MRSGFGGFRRDVRGGMEDVGAFERQLRAFATTMRYAVAGSTIFGAIGEIRGLNQVQQQLGLISAISPTAFKNYALVGDELEKFGEQAEDAAYRALTPVEEFNDGLVNLVSTVQNVPRSEVVPILEQIAQTARLSLTPVDEATKGITGLAVAFGDPVTLSNMQKYLAMYQQAVFTVPGGAAAGPQILQQLPQLSQVSRLANLSPAQMFGLLNTSLRTGGNPATSIRGLQYLIQGLAQPPSDEAKAALAGIGITPEFTQQQGGLATLLRVVEEIRKRGVRGNTANLKAMSPDVLDQLQESGGQLDLAGLGISGAGAEFARTAIGRIHGVRAAILLASQDDKMIDDIREMTNLSRNHSQQLDTLRKSWQRFADEAQLRKASMAVDQMGLDIVQAFEPVLNFGASGLGHLRNLVDRNPDAFAYGTLGVGGAYGAYRIFGGMRGAGLLGRGLPLGAAAIDAIQAAGTPGSQRGDSPINPVWVAVAYSLSGIRGLGQSRLPGDDLRNHPDAWGTSGAAGRSGRLATLGRAGFGIGAAALGGYSLYEYTRGNILAERQRRIQGTTLLDYLREGTEGGITIPFGLGKFRSIGGHGIATTPQERRILDRLEKGYINESAAERMLRRVATNEHLSRAGVPRLEGKAEVTVRLTDQTGKQIQESKVPLELYPSFTQPAPTTRGKPKTYRSG